MINREKTAEIKIYIPAQMNKTLDVLVEQLRAENKSISKSKLITIFIFNEISDLSLGLRKLTEGDKKND